MKQPRSDVKSTSSKKPAVKSGAQAKQARRHDKAVNSPSGDGKSRPKRNPRPDPKRAPQKAAQPNDKAASIDFRQQAKSGLHKRNPHNGRYDFERLVKAEPQLKRFVIKNPYGESSINFSDPQAVKMLNKALLAAYYHVCEWDIPEGYLCPPIPGRADYIHRVAELLDAERKGGYPHHAVTALDIGVGANCIYPIVGVREYDWHCVGSDVDPRSIQSAQAIVEHNACLSGRISLRLQSDSEQIFHGVIHQADRFDVTTCNPPFHRSQQEASQGTERKLANLAKNKQKRGSGQAASPLLSTPNQKGATPLNFGGQNAELWCPGGEAAFVRRMAKESRDFAAQVLWFTTLISKNENVKPLRKQLEQLGVKAIRVVEMSQGQKVSRFVAWSYLDQAQRQAWIALK